MIVRIIARPTDVYNLALARKKKMGVTGIETNGDRLRWVILLAEQSDCLFFRAPKHERVRERGREKARKREKSMRNWETMNEMFAKFDVLFENV